MIPSSNRTSVKVTPVGEASVETVYTYDVLNRLWKVTDPDSGLTVYTYDNVGNLDTVTYGNGAVADYDYDDLNRLTKITQTVGGEIYTYAYTLGPAGNRTKLVETLPGPTITSRTVDWSYDDLYRLKKETIKQNGQTVRITEYTYDKVGNRLTKSLIQGVTRYDTTYDYDDMDRLLTETTTTTQLADAVAGPDDIWLAANPRRAGYFAFVGFCALAISAALAPLGWLGLRLRVARVCAAAPWWKTI